MMRTLSIITTSVYASPMNFAVFTRTNDEPDNYEDEYVPGFENKNLDDYIDITDDYDTYFDTDAIEGNDGLIEAAESELGKCPIDNKCQQGCVPLNNAQISGQDYNCTCWEGFDLLCDGLTCGASYEVPMPKFENDGSCPENFIPLGGRFDKSTTKSCFFLGDKKGTREKAQGYCEAMGAQLAKIENKEQNFYLGHLMTDEKIFWVGGKYVDFEFSWNDGSKIEFTKWAENEPTMSYQKEIEGEPENCVVSNWGYLSEWNDLHCEHDDIYYACSTEPHW